VRGDTGYFLNVKSILRGKGGKGDSFELRTHCVVSCKRLTKQKNEKKRGGQRVPLIRGR